MYLFLVTVGDAQGLSYYSDAALSRHLQMDPVQLAAARRQLQAADLIAYAKPLYQVLALLRSHRRARVPRGSAPGASRWPAPPGGRHRPTYLRLHRPSCQRPPGTAECTRPCPIRSRRTAGRRCSRPACTSGWPTPPAGVARWPRSPRRGFHPAMATNGPVMIRQSRVRARRSSQLPRFDGEPSFAFGLGGRR